MAVIYLRSTTGSDANNGSTWALAKATLAAALTAAGAGGTVYASDNHSESVASAINLVSPGTTTSPVTVLCVDDTGNPEPPTTLATTAIVATSTGANNITISGVTYVYGFTFRVNAAGSNNTSHFNVGSGNAVTNWILEECLVDSNSSSASSRIQYGSATVEQTLTLINSDMDFGHASQRLLIQGTFTWIGGILIGSSVPTIFMQSGQTSRPVIANIIGVDLSVLAGSSTIVDDQQVCPAFSANLVNCKLGSGVTPFDTPTNLTTRLQLINCDSGDTNYRYQLETLPGVVTQETTIVLTGGASDGTTPISRKLVSAAGSAYYFPLQLDLGMFWNESLASQTVTVEILTDNVTLTNAECWLEISYASDASFPLYSLANDRSTSILATPANQTSSSVTWTTTGIGTPVKQKLEVTFTAANKGPVYAKVYLAKPSTTVYVDPKILSTSGRQYQMQCAYINEGAGSSGGGLRLAGVGGLASR